MAHRAGNTGGFKIWRFLLFGAVIVLGFGVLVPTVVGASESIAERISDGEAFELTLADAIRFAFEFDLDHEIARLNWENARIDNMIAQASGPISAYEGLQRQLQERRAENAYVSARQTLVLDIVQEYFEVKQAEHQVDIARRQADIARSELDVVRQMVRIGERHPQDELREQNRVANAELSAQTAARTYANRRAALLHRLGLSESGTPILVDEPRAEPFVWTLEETIAYALEHSFSVWERDMNLRIAVMDLEALKVQDPAPLPLEKAQNDLRITELNTLQGDRTFRNNVTTSYYNLADAARRLQSAQVDLELAQAAYDSARRQHEAGLTTDIDWERAQLDRLDAEHSHRDTVTAYLRARLDLFNLIGHPLDLEPSEENARR